MKKKRYATIGDYCVACGSCVKICPFGAITIKNGIKASVDEKRCVGCGKCGRVCPASVIEIIVIEVDNEG